MLLLRESQVAGEGGGRWVGGIYVSAMDLLAYLQAGFCQSIRKFFVLYLFCGEVRGSVDRSSNVLNIRFNLFLSSI